MPRLLVGAVAFTVAAIVGAYLDWILWVDYDGLLITAVAALTVLVGGLVALRRPRDRAQDRRDRARRRHRPDRRPDPRSESRTPLYQPDGTMTLRLESPVEVVGTGPRPARTSQAGPSSPSAATLTCASIHQKASPSTSTSTSATAGRPSTAGLAQGRRSTRSHRDRGEDPGRRLAFDGGDGARRLVDARVVVQQCGRFAPVRRARGATPRWV